MLRGGPSEFYLRPSASAIPGGDALADVKLATELDAKTGAVPRTEQAVWGVGSA